MITRPIFKLPKDYKVAVWVVPNIEYFDIGGTNYGGVGVSVPPPNVFDYAARDYGLRVGIWRLMDVLDKYKIKATVALNSEVCSHYPVIIEEAKKRGWEFMGHGMTNSVMLGGKNEEEERQIIRTTVNDIAEFTGERPKGWLGPALSETFNTPDILAEEGIKYLCDWCSDDQPYEMKVKKGHLISIPYSIDINDIPIFIYNHQTPSEFSEIAKEQFAVLYEDSNKQSRIMCIAVHPFLIGQAYRIRSLDNVLKYITQHRDVWFPTGWEIARFFYQQYLKISI
jgi:peptidoglycan/xylan/chitin deacetylase (PgdA/CDA1 family)